MLNLRLILEKMYEDGNHRQALSLCNTRLRTSGLDPAKIGAGSLSEYNLPQRICGNKYRRGWLADKVHALTCVWDSY